MENKNILIVAGEASGDIHAANLVAAIKEIFPKISFFGLGGEHLRKQGVNLYFDIVGIAVVGIFEVLKNLGKFQKIFHGLLEEVDKIKPDLAILVDYPGFNLRLAKKLKERNIPIIYYISPQVWAWGENRIKTIKKIIAHMIVVFKFEEELYNKHGIPVSFVGHPLLDTVQENISPENLLARLKPDVKTRIFSLLPGSREKEVKTLLPIMLRTAELIQRKLPDSKFIILRSPAVKEDLFDKIICHYKIPVELISGMTKTGLSISDFAIVASGTATLETAILKIPMVILYKVSFLTWAYLKMLIKIPYIGLVNVVKQEKFIAEFIQYDAKPEKIADYIVSIITDAKKLNRIKEGLTCITDKLGKEGASKKAAKVVADFLNNLHKNENKPDKNC